MTIKDQIFSNLKEIQNQRILYQILDFVNIVRRNLEEARTRNLERVLAFSGALQKEDAEEIQKDLEDQFNEIEGDW